MIYIIFVGLVVAAAMTSPVASVGNAILFTSAIVAFATSVSTFITASILGASSSFSDSLKANITALVAAVLIFAFAFQVASKVPIVFLASPLLAFIVATVFLARGLSLSTPKAAIVSAVGCVITSITMKVAGAQIIQAAMGQHAA